LVTRVQDWPWSSFHRYVEAGDYELQWGRENPVPNWNAPEWGGDI
jgi:putative transposase